MRLAGWLRPRLIPWLLDKALGMVECKRYNNVSFKVYNIGSANNSGPTPPRWRFPVRHAVEAVETVLRIAEQYAAQGSIYHTAPVAMRFVAPSRALMSMMHGGERMTIELIHLIDHGRGVEIIHAHEEAPLSSACALTGTGERTRAQRGGGSLSRTRQVAGDPRAARPEGVFESPFSKRVGLTSRGFQSG